MTFAIPRCPPAYAITFSSTLPGVRVSAGLVDNLEKWLDGWSIYGGAQRRATGEMINTMLRDVETPLAMVVLGEMLPNGIQDVETMIRVLTQGRLCCCQWPFR